ISLTWADDDAPFADIEFTGEEGWVEVTTQLTQIPEGSGSVVVTSTGGVDLDALTFTASGEGPGEPGDPIHVPAEQVSIQMYSLPPWVEEAGLQPVLARLAEIGLENIEPYGGNFDGYTAEDFRAMVDELGLSVPSSHYN